MSCSQFDGTDDSSTNQAILMPGQAASQQIHGPSGTTSGQACCESGRPVITDPITGQTMCSCQYDAQLLNYQRIAASGLPLNMYGAAAAAAAAYGGEQGFLPLGAAADQSAFYSPTANGFDLKDNLEAWRSLPYAASMYYPYDSAALAGYPFANGYGVDLNGARRKNATRETTSTLKAWLHEHKKNPYPTKGEKIMLAIITKMTLTQVSTWFANARRRLKKENKMTWSPRNRCDDDDDGDGEDGRSKEDDNDPKSPVDSCKTSDDIRRHESKFGADAVRRNLMEADDDSKSSDLADPCRRIALGKDPLGSPLSDGSVGSDSESSLLSPTPPQNLVTDLQSTPKPRIWSIVDTATSSTSTGTCSTLSSSIITTTGGATRLSPLQRAARLDYLSPYPKPSWYTGSLGATTTVPGTFPLSAVYSPIVPSASALSAVTPVSGAPQHSSESALSRLRTVAGTAFSTGDMTSKPSTVSTPNVFNLSTNRLTSSASSPSSGSSAAIAAVAGVSIGHLTSMSNRVVS